jgi:hypothetical protein
MFNTDFGRLALSTVGALFFSLSLVSAAVGPAHLADTATVVYANMAPGASGGSHA